MSGGQRPKPTALHKLEGTFNATRHGKGRAGEPKPETELGDAPEWFSAGQRAAWEHVRKHAPKGLLTELDRGLVEHWAVAADQARTATELLNLYNEDALASGRAPYLVMTASGFRVSPLLRVRREAAEQMVAISDRLGLSPVARTRIHTEPPRPEEPDGAWAVLRKFPVIPGGKDRQPAVLPKRKRNGAKA